METKAKKEEKRQKYIEEQKLRLLEAWLQTDHKSKSDHKKPSTQRRRDLSSYHAEQKKKLQQRKKEILEYWNSMLMKERV